MRSKSIWALEQTINAIILARAPFINSWAVFNKRRQNVVARRRTGLRIVDVRIAREEIEAERLSSRFPATVRVRTEGAQRLHLLRVNVRTAAQTQTRTRTSRGKLRR